MSANTPRARTGDRGDREHGAKIALIAAALARETASPTMVCESAISPPPPRLAARAGDQRGMVGLSAQASEPTTKIGTREKNRPAAVDVGELAVERRDGGCGEQIGGDDPGEALDVRVGAADGRERGRDDRLVERRKEHRQHQPDQDATHRRVIEAHGRVEGGRSRRTPKKEKGAQRGATVPSQIGLFAA